MPIDQYHSFGEGHTYKYTKYNFFSMFILKSLSKFIFYDKTVIRKIWDQFLKNTTIHESCKLGINAWCINNSNKNNIMIGENTVVRGILRRELYSNGVITIGNNVYIGDDVIISCCENIKIGSGVLIAHGVQIFDNDTHPIDPYYRFKDWQFIIGKNPKKPKIEKAPIIINDYCWLGFNSIIMKGVSLGKGCVVAAGSVVTKSFPEYSLVGGNPAKIIKKITPVKKL